MLNRAEFKRRHGRGDRQAITRFSPRSRKNMLERFATIDKEKSGGATFVTLTYASNMQDDQKAYAHLRNFLRRVDYEIAKNGTSAEWKPVKGNRAFYCWRKEDQARGAIHFHLMMFGIKWLDKDWLAHTWSEIIQEHQILCCSDGSEYESPVMTRVEFCRSVRKTWYYLAKYLAKKEVNDDVGRDPGNSGENVDLTSAQIRRNRGRFWGWENRKFIPYAEKTVAYIVTSWAELRRFRWDMRTIEEWTWKVSLTDTLKLFWFFPEVDVVELYMRSQEGRRISDAFH